MIAPARVMLFTGGPLHGKTIPAEDGPLPPMWGRRWTDEDGAEQEIWYSLVRLSMTTAVYVWCDWAAAIRETGRRP